MCRELVGLAELQAERLLINNLLENRWKYTCPDLSGDFFIPTSTTYRRSVIRELGA